MEKSKVGRGDCCAMRAWARKREQDGTKVGESWTLCKYSVISWHFWPIEAHYNFQTLLDWLLTLARPSLLASTHMKWLGWLCEWSCNVEIPSYSSFSFSCSRLSQSFQLLLALTIAVHVTKRDTPLGQVFIRKGNEGNKHLSHAMVYAASLWPTDMVNLLRHVTLWWPEKGNSTYPSGPFIQWIINHLDLLNTDCSMVSYVYPYSSYGRFPLD